MQSKDCYEKVLFIIIIIWPSLIIKLPRNLGTSGFIVLSEAWQWPERAEKVLYQLRIWTRAVGVAIRP